MNDDSWASLAANAQDEFQGINLSNFFEPTTCDIEQDIYRLDTAVD